MRRVWVLGLVMVSGCTTAPPPPQKDYSKMTKCEQVAEALGSPYANATTKSVAMEVGRNHGCFGRPQTQRVEIDQTVRVITP